MSNVLVNKDKLDVLANAISAKSGEPLTLTLDEMVSAVDGIEVGGGGITPTGNIDIEDVGTTDVTNYATATVPEAVYVSGVQYQYATESGQRKFEAQGYFNEVPGDGGFIRMGGFESITTDAQKFNAIATGTSVTPTESAQTIGGANVMMEGAVTVNAIPSNYVGSGITQRSSSDLSASGATVTAPSGYYASSASKSVASGSASAPSTISGTSASVSTGTNTLTLSKTVSVTPTVSAGYVSSGTATNSSVSLTANVTTKGATTYTPTTSNQTIASGTYLTGTQTISGDANLVAGNIKSGTTIFGVTGTYSGGGGSLSYDTKTATASNYPTSLSFSSMKGEPKFFAVRLNAQVSSSGSTTYYYIVDIISNCNGSSPTTHGNCFRIGSTRRVDNITSGYSWSYSGTTLTITSSASSRSASPGAFYSGSYELIYAY